MAYGYDDEGDMQYMYDVALKIEHPQQLGEDIGLALGLDPDAWQPETLGVWSHTVSIQDHRLFFKVVVDLLTLLESAADFVQALNDGGGRTTIWLRLPGHTNIGDILAPRDILRMARLKIELGVEVVPDLQSEPALRRPYPRAQPGPASA